MVHGQMYLVRILLEVDLDVDARSISFFDAPGSSSMDQISNELRYSGSLTNKPILQADYSCTKVMSWLGITELLEEFVCCRWLNGIFHGSQVEVFTVEQTALFTTIDYSINEIFL